MISSSPYLRPSLEPTEMIEPLWKILSLLMSLLAFTVVGYVNLTNGSDLLWVAIRCVVTFVVCWFILSNLGGVLSALLPSDGDQISKKRSDDTKSAEKEG
jgi:hypothetical protein